MRRLLLLLILAPLLSGATKYVKTPCTNNGDGLANSCAASPGGSGAYNSIANMVSGAACGDTINITAGTYNIPSPSSNWGKGDCTGNPLIYQANGWTADGAGTQDVVYIGSVTPLGPADWTVCTWDGSACDCDAGNLNIEIGAGGATACGETYYHTKTEGGTARAYWAIKPDGSITPRRAASTDMTAQYDAYNAEAAQTILVRWAGTGPPTDASINADNNPMIRVSASKYHTIRGLRFRWHINALVHVLGGSDYITVEDNTFKYVNDSANGSGRPFNADDVPHIYLIANEFAYSSSEAVHITMSGANSAGGLISKNWIHDIGDATVLGGGTGGTANCTTFTPTTTADMTATGDFSGLVVDDNLLEHCKQPSNGKGLKGFIMETRCDGITFSNNVIRDVGNCFKWSPENGAGPGQHTNNHTVFNNVCFDTNATAGADGIAFYLQSSSSDITGNKIYNNTTWGTAGNVFNCDSTTQINNNTIRNNVFASDYNGKLIQCASTGANEIFTNNDVWSSTLAGGSNIATWGASSYTCATIGTLDASDKCADPVFVDTATDDYHIQTSSPAKDAGTSTGMPAGRTADINNTIASLHGLPSYADNGAQYGVAWDIGADEYQGGAPVVPHRVLVISQASACGAWKWAAP